MVFKSIFLSVFLAFTCLLVVFYAHVLERLHTVILTIVVFIAYKFKALILASPSPNRLVGKVVEERKDETVDERNNDFAGRLGG